MSTEKYACFNCQKVFAHGVAGGATSRFMTTEQRRGKRLAEGAQDKKTGLLCPSCAQALIFVGIDFKTPKSTDVRSWKLAERQFRLPSL